MFNFFDEIKKKGNVDLTSYYNIVFIGGRLLYVEGHCGLSVLTDEEIAFKVKRGRVVVSGKDLVLSELTENTLLISGEISKCERF